MNDFQTRVAIQLHKNMQISRTAILGEDDPKPINLVNDVEAMSPGAVVANRQPRRIVLMASI
ncbi:hypothetical protein [Thalassobaculum salexigens]|uniref:hypothetical protein n=1 Tax=Thalassobaculum salexigens TaxID=455360 RepID=UPI0012EB1BD7|nr:hypothetical protein [Thalassobaculum salexigens]